MTDENENAISYDEAVAMLPDSDRIHTFVNPAGMLLGADWDRDDVLSLLRSGRPELGGEMCTEMGHGLIAWRAVGGERSPVFIETKKT